MSETCNQSCSTCGKDCSDRREALEDLREKPNAMSRIGKVIAVVSGKGGVGKSSVTSMLAVAVRRLGSSVAVLDADITGPSIPRAFGITGRARGGEEGVVPSRSATGIGVMSINLLLERETDPVVWRGPILGNMVRQFWTDVVWGDVDYMFIDMPPGTGDIPLTVFQSIPVDGIVVVLSPQELVSMIVSKAIAMANMMKIPVLGLVENMSYFLCPDNGKKYRIFGESRVDDIAAKYGVPVLAKIPVDPGISSACDRGTIEKFTGEWLDAAAHVLTGKETKDHDENRCCE